MMHFRSNMTRAEFIDWLRYSAISGGMPQQFLDRLAELRGLDDLKAENERLEDELAEVEENRDALRVELQGLIKAVENCDGVTSKSITSAIKRALLAVGRGGA